MTKISEILTHVIIKKTDEEMDINYWRNGGGVLYCKPTNTYYII